MSQHDHFQILTCLGFANQFQTNNLTVYFICVSLTALRSCHFCANEPYRSITRLWSPSPIGLGFECPCIYKKKNTTMLFFPFSILSMLATSNNFPPADHNITLGWWCSVKLYHAQVLSNWHIRTHNLLHYTATQPSDTFSHLHLLDNLLNFLF